MTDLHCDNCVVVGQNDASPAFLPIDIECIFEPVTSLVETGLLNLPSLPIQRSGIYAQWGERFLNGGETIPITPVLDELLLQFDRGRTGFGEAVDILWASLVGHPIRRIVRSTSDYRKALSENNFSGFQLEELHQLVARDIPYFYHIHPMPTLYYFWAPNEMSEAKADFSLRNKLSKEDLKDLARLDRLRKVVTLQLLRRFWPSGVSHVDGTLFRARRDSEMLTLETKDFSIATRI